MRYFHRRNQRPPNILLLFTDMQRPDTIAALGNPVIRTPHLDRLVREGTTFTRCYSPSPVCVPARCCLHYGLYPQRTGTFENRPMMPDNGASYPAVLGRHGYRTHAVGKCHFTPDVQALRGFQTRRTQEECTSDPRKDDYVAWLQQHGHDHYEPHGARGEMYYIPQVSTLPAAAHPTPISDVQVDRLRKEVYFRNGVNGLWRGRFVEKTGQLEMFDLQYPGFMQGGGTGLQMVPGADGMLYGLGWAQYFFRWDRSGKFLPWESPSNTCPEWDAKVQDFRKKGTEHTPAGATFAYVPVSMTMMPHMLSTRGSDGHLFVLHPPTDKDGARELKSMHEYLTSGKELTTPDNFTLWKVSDYATGPRFDAAGNIYIAEALRPANWVMPPELADCFAKHGVSIQPKGARGAAGTHFEGAVGAAANLYGSILKFSPKGGLVNWQVAKDKVEPYTGEPKLDPSLKVTENLDFLDQHCNLGTGLKVTGAEWIHPGIGHQGNYYCNCESVTFDVDEFGRVFYPDTPLFRACVLDTAGNVITRFGDYGEENCLGSEGPVVDPKTNRLRPRRNDDPAELKSPFAQPDIGLSWLVGIGVTDRYIYLGDALNERLLRARMVYAAEATCEIR